MFLAQGLFDFALQDMRHNAPFARSCSRRHHEHTVERLRGLTTNLSTRRNSLLRNATYIRRQIILEALQQNSNGLNNEEKVLNSIISR